MATLYDVCNKTGLSTATVSRVINGSSKVSEKTRQIVLKAMKELDYQPNQAARMLAGKKTDTIGVVFPEIDNGFYVQVLRGIDDVARETKLHLLTAFYHDPDGLRDTLLSLASRGRTDALILMNNSLSDEQVRQTVKNNVPLVLIGHSIEASTLFDVVGIDNTNGAFMAVMHLFEQQRKNPLVITGPFDNFDSIQRLNGTRMAYEKMGHDFPAIPVLEGDFTYESGESVMNEYLEDHSLPDAIFAFNDRMALGAIEALQKRGCNIPEEVAVVGFDDSEIALYAGLTTVHVPMRDIGRKAANLAIRRIKEPELTPCTITVETSLVKRKSTGRS